MAPSFPHPQAQSSSTFIPPPLDGSLTIPEIYDFHLKHNGEHPLFVYDDENGVVRTIRWKQAVQAIHTAGRFVRSATREPQAQDHTPVVAILAVNG